MTIANRLREFMDGAGVVYGEVAHGEAMTTAGCAQAAHVPGRQVAKPVVIHHETGYVLAVVPSTHRVELSTLQELLDRRLGLASEPEIAKLFDDCATGAVPPIGAAYGVPTYLDESLDKAEDLYFEGGDHRTLVHVSRDGFRRLTRDAKRARFSHAA